MELNNVIPILQLFAVFGLAGASMGNILSNLVSIGFISDKSQEIDDLLSISDVSVHKNIQEFINKLRGNDKVIFLGGEEVNFEDGDDEETIKNIRPILSTYESSKKEFSEYIVKYNEFSENLHEKNYRTTFLMIGLYCIFLLILFNFAQYSENNYNTVEIISAVTSETSERNNTIINNFSEQHNRKLIYFNYSTIMSLGVIFYFLLCQLLYFFYSRRERKKFVKKLDDKKLDKPLYTVFHFLFFAPLGVVLFLIIISGCACWINSHENELIFGGLTDLTIFFTVIVLPFIYFSLTQILRHNKNVLDIKEMTTSHEKEINKAIELIEKRHFQKT